MEGTLDAVTNGALRGVVVLIGPRGGELARRPVRTRTARDSRRSGVRALRLATSTCARQEGVWIESGWGKARATERSAHETRTITSVKVTSLTPEGPAG